MKKLFILLVAFVSVTIYAGTASPGRSIHPFGRSNEDLSDSEKKVFELRKKARERMKLDNDAYSTSQQEEIEELYQSISKKWQKGDGKKALKELLKKYKDANRTGCAMLYLGQITDGKAREDFLNKAIAEYSDCWYGDGVQVGAYARYLLGVYYQKKKQQDKAQKLFNEIKEQYPDSVDHRGTPLVDLIEKQNALLKK